jgi:DNA repair photolyase
METPVLLFADSPPGPAAAQLVGIARLAAQGEALDDGHNVEYQSLTIRSLLSRNPNPRLPFRWTINPYRGCEFGCHYCFARYTHEFMELRQGRDFEQRIFAKQNAAWRLRHDLRQVKPGEMIAMGTATDPYQPAERRFGVTRSILEELAAHRGLQLGIVTKSNLIVRDVELLQRVAERNSLVVHLTVTTVNVELARLLEPRAPRPDLRLEAVQKLVAAGINAGVFCAPVLPGITDSQRDLEALVRAAAQAGARSFAANPLFLKPCSAQVFLPFVEQHFPALADSYRQRYGQRAFVSAAYRKRISELVAGFKAKYGIGRIEMSVPASESQLPLFAA